MEKTVLSDVNLKGNIRMETIKLLCRSGILNQLTNTLQRKLKANLESGCIEHYTEEVKGNFRTKPSWEHTDSAEQLLTKITNSKNQF